MTANYRVVRDAGGDAPWLVMVHGMSQDHRVFSAQTAAFKDRYRILLIDFPGHGLSTDIPGPFGHLELAAHVDRAIDHVGVSHCDYWATHTGTSLGLLLATENPARFRSLILEGVVLPGRATPSVDAAFRRVREAALKRGVPEARKLWFHEADFFAVMRRHPTQCRAEAHWKMVSEFSGAPWLYQGEAKPVASVDALFPSLDLPVLLYNGEHDLRDFLDAADHLEALLPRVTRAAIPDAGGFPAWEFPERVNRLVSEFLLA